MCQNEYVNRSETAASGAGDAPYHHGDLRRSLIEAALNMMKEGQDWSFSLREVAKRAGVSHNAPYHHFADKRGLLSAVAVVGFERLAACLGDVAGSVSIKGAEYALLESACAYVRFGMENPAHYRLMFSSALNGPQGRLKEIVDAGAVARAHLEEILRQGALSGAFSGRLARARELKIAALTAWSTVHGFTMLAIDGLPGPEMPIAGLAREVSRTACRSFLKRER